MVRQLIDSFRSGKQDLFDVWMEKEGEPVLVRYMAVRDKKGTFLGTLEIVQKMGFAKSISPCKVCALPARRGLKMMAAAIAASFICRLRRQKQAAPPCPGKLIFKIIRYRKTDTVKPAVPMMIPDGGFLYKQAL